MGRDHGVPVVGGQLAEVAVPGEAGVVDEDPDRTEGLRRLLDSRRDLRFVRHVGHDRGGLPPASVMAVSDLASAVGVDIEDRDRVAEGGEVAGDAPADAAGGTGDDGGGY